MWHDNNLIKSPNNWPRSDPPPLIILRTTSTMVEAANQTLLSLASHVDCSMMASFRNEKYREGVTRFLSDLAISKRTQEIMSFCFGISKRLFNLVFFCFQLLWKVEKYNNFINSMLVFPKEKTKKLSQNCKSYHEIMDIFGPDLHSARQAHDSDSLFAFSHSLHHQVGILEVFLTLSFRPRNNIFKWTKICKLIK